MNYQTISYANEKRRPIFGKLKSGLSLPWTIPLENLFGSSQRSWISCPRCAWL